MKKKEKQRGDYQLVGLVLMIMKMDFKSVYCMSYFLTIIIFINIMYKFLKFINKLFSNLIIFLFSF